jgi:hypothetical protein
VKKLYDFERCTAALADGTRCRYEATDYVRNPGAPFPYEVCGVHKRVGEQSVEKTGALPDRWSRFFKNWL